METNRKLKTKIVDTERGYIIGTYNKEEQEDTVSDEIVILLDEQLRKQHDLRILLDDLGIDHISEFYEKGISHKALARKVVAQLREDHEFQKMIHNIMLQSPYFPRQGITE